MGSRRYEKATKVSCDRNNFRRWILAENRQEKRSLKIGTWIKAKRIFAMEISSFRKFLSKTNIFREKNPIFDKTYQYIRAQSYSNSEFGKLYQLFYNNGQRVIPERIKLLLRDPLALAVWFMDDGYYYGRDKMAYIYLPKYDQISINFLLSALQENFDLFPTLKIKKRGEYVLVFPVKETEKLMKLIRRFLIPTMVYKSPPLDPVSTESPYPGLEI